MKTQAKKERHTKDFTVELAAMLPPERVHRAKREAEHEIFRIRLAELRKRMGIRQEDFPSFSQSAISKLETRSDVKLSTLIEYLENLGMGLEIKVYPKNKAAIPTEEIVLLKV